MSSEDLPPPYPPPAQEDRPPLPPRPRSPLPPTVPHHPQNDNNPLPSTSNFLPPPKRVDLVDSDSSSPTHFTRDPNKLVAYLVPFPKPQLHNVPVERVPPRFLIYTPPPPPLSAPAEGEKEGQRQKLQRKFQEHVREAKSGNAETMSWKGVKGKAMQGINWGMGQTKSSGLEFLNRIDTGGSNKTSPGPRGGEDGGSLSQTSSDATKSGSSGLDEMILIYPESMTGGREEIQQEFISSMLRYKSKAERDAVIATGLLPVSAAVDILATVVWPFGGLLEIDGVWAYASIRGAKNSRHVTKRLKAGTADPDNASLHLNFIPSARLQLLERYLAARCHERDPKMFPGFGVAPTETHVLDAIGWSSSLTGADTRNLAEEHWELAEVKDDLKSVMQKGAKEWGKWCKKFEEDPEKALKK